MAASVNSQFGRRCHRRLGRRRLLEPAFRRGSGRSLLVGTELFLKLLLIVEFFDHVPQRKVLTEGFVKLIQDIAVLHGVFDEVIAGS